jgi:hypothetical protein
MPGLTPLTDGPTLLPRVPDDLVPAATDATGGLVRDDPASGRVGAVTPGRVTPGLARATEDDAELAVLARDAVLPVTDLDIAGSADVDLGRVVDGLRVVAGLNPPEGFRAVLSAKDEPEA